MGKTHIKFDLSLSVLGFITWIVFLILRFAVPGFYATIGAFWFWFPLWIGFAIDFTLFLIVLIIAIIISKL